MKIQFFGMLAEAVGSPFIILEKHHLSVQELIKELVNSYPKLGNLSFKVAVNQSLVEDDCRLNENDEIALLPPFAGG